MNEIFRHFRVKDISLARMEVIPDKKGGISYMLKPTGEGTYDFWIYICPLNTEFSAKQAVSSLRFVETQGCVPWGSIRLDGSPIIDLLVKATTRTSLPTETSSMVDFISRHNLYMEQKLKQLKMNYNSKAKSDYETID